MQIFKTNEFARSLQKLQVQGGLGQRKAEEAYSILGKAVDGVPNPFHGVPTTNHGESRIKHCVKYDLGDGFRLVTIKDSKVCMFCYVGNHQKTDAWLERNKGLTIIKNSEGQYDISIKSTNVTKEEERISIPSDKANVKLLERLTDEELALFLSIAPPNTIARMLPLDTYSTDELIHKVSMSANDERKSTLIYDVLMHLRAGDKNQAIQRMHLETGKAIEIESIAEDALVEIDDGINVKRVPIGSREYIDWFSRFMRNSGYQDWMLFMHPEQKKIVEAEFEGPAKLSGVSGSGKTCIVVNRAIRLATESADAKILVTTLNKSLAKLIAELLDHACPDGGIRSRIDCKSYFDLCRDILIRLEPENAKLYDEFTWKTDEHIEEVWREFYRCKLNNEDAKVLFSLHKSLNSQNVNPESYIKQEFDWLRSACGKTNRSEYLKLDRKGRAIPFQPQQRELILSGVDFWESKMEFVGSIDYLGLAVKLHEKLQTIAHEYTSILVDEAQDFGTIELEVLRSLVPPSKNDLFLAGDMAQHILPKHQSFGMAGVDVPGPRSRRITKNYRNSREILRAAYQVLVDALDSDIPFDGELDILDPQYANFSTAKPSLLIADTLEKEIACAIAHMNDCKATNPNFKGCLTIVGHSWLSVKRFAEQNDFVMLDGHSGLLNGHIFVSDLEQTKGYEFDTVCIVNCVDGLLPHAEMPAEEHFRDACKFYVAMTRAKKELIISYNTTATKWINKPQCLALFEQEEWSNYVELDSLKEYGKPVHITLTHGGSPDEIKSMTGCQFLYTRHALGLPLPLQDKIEQLVDGNPVSRGNVRVKWANIGSAYSDVMKSPEAKNLFGANTHKQFLDVIAPLL